MEAKTHCTAVVLIPPESCWGPIQKFRKHHDRQVRRWMPHITLLYPFRPRALFDEVEENLSRALSPIKPFEVYLDHIFQFYHDRGRYTLWIAPEPKRHLVRLQAALMSAAPDCEEVSRHPGGFTPHLSMGQARGKEAMMRLKGSLQASWQSLRFVAGEVSLIWREPPPDGVFRVDRKIALGS